MSNSDNRIFNAVQLIVLLAIFACIITWATVIVPIIAISLGGLYLVLFLICWAARLVVKVVQFFKKAVA